MTPERPRVLVARPRADAEPLAHRLEALGYEAVLAPVLAIVPLAGAASERTSPDALLATSANAFLQPFPAAWLSTRLYAVGTATAAAARVAGFADLRVAGGDAVDLAQTVLRETAPQARLLLLAGRPRKPDLEQTLRGAGRVVQALDCYEARPAIWSGRTVLDLRRNWPAAALHYSRRSAALARTAAGNARLGAAFGAMIHVCLSEDVAGALRADVTGPLMVAAQPDANSLLQALARILPLR